MSDVAAIAEFTPENNPHVKVMRGGYTLSNLKTLLKPAMENKFGVVAINMRNKYIMEAVLEAAWREKSPVILECAESEAKYCNMPPDRMANFIYEGIDRMIEKYGYSVPVAVHQDHVQKDLTFIDRSVEAGFSSVEADLSKLPLKENIEKSKEIVNKLHPMGVSVELEEGEIGAAGALADPDMDKNIENYYTKVEDAYELAKEANPDALAVFVGNGHGKYLKEPRIGYDRIREIAEKIKEFDCPVVLHGGSGLTPKVFNDAIDAGAAKINYATSVQAIFFDNMPEDLIRDMEAKGKELNRPMRKVYDLFEERVDNDVPKENLEKAVQAMIEHISMMMREGFRSSGKAELYKK